MSHTNDASREFWTQNPTGERKSFLSGDAKKQWAADGTAFTILRVAERQFNDRRNGMPVPQWALSVQEHPGEPVYTLTLGKTEGRNEFMQNLREFIDTSGSMVACLDYIEPENGNGFYILIDPDFHPANMQKTLGV